MYLTKKVQKKSVEFYYILRFLEKPCASFREFIYVPESSIVLHGDDNAIVYTYTTSDFMQNEIMRKERPFYYGRYMYKIDSEKMARQKCNELNSRKLEFEDDDRSDSEDLDPEINKSNDSRKRKSPYSLTVNKKRMRLNSNDTENEPNITEIDFYGEEIFEQNDTNFMNILQEQSISLEKQLTGLDETKEILSGKATLVKAFMEKLQIYKNQNNNSNETEKEKHLKEMVKQRDKIIADLNMQIEGKITKTDIKPTNVKTNWTLKCNKGTYGAFQLMPDSGVYVNGVALCYCLRLARNKFELAQMLLWEIYSTKALKTCNFNGSRGKAALDEHAKTVLLKFVELNTDFEDVPKMNIMTSIRRKLFNYNKISYDEVESKKDVIV